MAVSDGFLEYVLDQLSKWGGVSARKMFGGAGLFRDNKMFCILVDDIAYLKVDESNRANYLAAGSSPLKPFQDRPTIMSYFEVPGDILENSDDLVEWASESLFIQKK